MTGANEAPRILSSTSLGKYRLIAELGHGGMAEVYLAVVRGPANFNKLVVIKQIRPQLAEDPEFLNMFLDEARLAARLSHPNVVHTNEVGQDGERFFIAMEYLEGQPLNRLIHRLQRAGTGLPRGMHLRILVDVLGGLHHAHELTDFDGTPLSVVHRDVTPHNIFVTYDGVVKVVDFGIAKALNSSAETRTGVLKGKVAYMAPEQARGERVDRRADLFSVGVLLWECATGKRLWKGVPDITILQRLLNGEIPPPDSASSDVHPRLSQITMKCLASDPADRYATAAELQLELESLIEELGERVQPRDLGRLVAQTFEADRIKIKGLIEEQLRVRPLDLGAISSSTLPLIDPAMSATSLPQVGDRSSSVPFSRSTSDISSVTPPHYTPVSQSMPRGPAVSSSTSPGFFTSAAPPNHPPSSRRALIAAAALAAGATLAVGFWIATRGAPDASHNVGSQSSAVTAVAPSASPATATAIATAAAASSVGVKVTAVPTEAKIFVDDKPVGTNPFTGNFSRDTGPHVVRVEAAGYQTMTRSISLDKDLDVEIALQKEEKSSPKHVVITAPPPDDDMKRPTQKPKRNVDPSNPYNQK
jgi:serine/threonine-protein kinase